MRGFCPRGFCPEGAYVLMELCPEGVLSAHHENETTVSVIIALLLSTGSTNDLVISGHVLWQWHDECIH